MNISEFELIRRIVKQIPSSLRESAGLRDDAGILRLSPRSNHLMTSDAIVEHIDFELKSASPEQIGKKAIAVNLSDIAAMGGEPRYFTIALGIPRYIRADWIRRFYKGLIYWAKRYRVICAGGDISRAPCFFSNITLLGERVKPPILRCNAQPGEWIGVTGDLGGSILGHHLTFKPRLEEGLFLADKGVSSMIDVSDGFLQDLTHLLEQSEVGCLIHLQDIPISRSATRQAKPGSGEGLSAALTDGEDFELIFTAREEIYKQINRVWNHRFPETRISWLGRVRRSKKCQAVGRDGRLFSFKQFSNKGFQHFK